MPKSYSVIRGLPVLDGTMVRTDSHFALATRRPNGRIRIRSHSDPKTRKPSQPTNLPVLRGAAVFLETIFHGIEALTYSAQTRGDSQESDSRGGILAAMLAALLIGGVLFIGLPLGLASILAGESSYFRWLEGGLKGGLMAGSLAAAGLLPGVRRFFQLHGAEHKCLHAFENGEELTIESARGQDHLHPRCQVGFLLAVVFLAVLVFYGPMPEDLPLTGNLQADRVALLAMKIMMLPLLAGLVYEFILLGSTKIENPAFRVLMAPLLAFQRLVVRAPSDDQLEVALAALRQLIRLGKGIPSPVRQKRSGAPDEDEFEIRGLAELGKVRATVDEFSAKW